MTAFDSLPGPTGALRGARVVEFGRYIPGPLLGMLLADQGADVVKIEPSGGDPARSHPAFATWNRGKRSVALDLKTRDGLERALELVRDADVIIENYRPGVADRLGIGYAALSKDNPRLVYVSLPGYGEGHPKRNAAGWDATIGAETGFFSPPEGVAGPVFSPLPMPSIFAAVLGALGVVAALLARERTGRGQRIEAPLHASMFSAIGLRLVRFHGSDLNSGSGFVNIGTLMSRQYRCADGRWVHNHGMYERFVHQFLKAAGREEWADEIISYVRGPEDPEAQAAWRRRFEAVFLERSAWDWERDINAVGGACTVCKTVDEWLVHEHPNAAGMVIEVDDAERGPMKQPGVSVNLRGSPGGARSGAPGLGEHTSQPWPTVAFETPRPSPPAAPPVTAVLEGVRVLDLCIVLAGPTCGRALAEFGADVITIDDPRRPSQPIWTVDVNRGKRSIVLDLKTPEGLEVFWHLVDTADVIVQSHRAGALDRLGIGYEAVKRRRPGIIYTSINAYGFGGPWEERPGWEQLAQATSGMQVRHGGREAQPKLVTYPVNDYGTGLLAAYGVALALLERERTGEGQQVDAGLALTAGLLQSPYFLDYEGYQRNDPEGLALRGFGALSRLYEASDGWLYLHCTGEASWRALASADGFEAVAADPRFSDPGARATNDEALTASLAGIFSTRPREAWAEVLTAAGVSMSIVRAVPDFHEDPFLRGAGLVVTREHPGLGVVDHVGPPPLLSAAPARLGAPAPQRGGDTRAILAELGYTPERIAALERAGAVAQS